MNLSVSLPVLLILLGVIVAVVANWTLGLLLIALGAAVVLWGMVQRTRRR